MLSSAGSNLCDLATSPRPNMLRNYTPWDYTRGMLAYITTWFCGLKMLAYLQTCAKFACWLAWALTHILTFLKCSPMILIQWVLLSQILACYEFFLLLRMCAIYIGYFYKVKLRKPWLIFNRKTRIFMKLKISTWLKV